MHFSKFLGNGAGFLAHYRYMLNFSPKIKLGMFMNVMLTTKYASSCDPNYTSTSFGKTIC